MPVHPVDTIQTTVPGEIAALTEKVTLVDADHVMIEDSEAGNVKKRVQVSSLGSGASSGVTVEAGSVQTDGAVLWRWAIDATTARPYFDNTGVTVGEEAIVKMASGRFYAEEAGL